MQWISAGLVCLSVSLHVGAEQKRETQPRWVKDLGYKSAELFPVAKGAYGYPYVTVAVNGRSILLPLDTANMFRLALSRSLAQSMKLTVIGETPSYDANGALLGKQRKFRVGSLSALGRAWSDQEAVEIEQPGLNGLLGPHYLLGRRFTLDYGQGLLAVSDSPIPRSAPGMALKLLQATDCPGMPVVEGSVNGRKVLIQIDTGKSRTCIDRALVRELALPKGANGYPVAQIKIGSWEFSVRSAREEDFSDIGKGLSSPILLGIGSDVLPQVLMTVDYRGRQVKLTPILVQ